MSSVSGSLKSRIAHLQTQSPIFDRKYYAITLLASENGLIVTSCQSGFRGYTETKPKREIRAACYVIPERMLDAWKSIGEPGVVVNDVADLALFLIIGGNAIVEQSLAEKYFTRLIAPEATVFSYSSGHTFVESVPNQTLQHAPTRKLRMQVIKRDKYKCKICGRSPATNVDVELHVHHIHPWGDGGVTEQDNLITICGTCHDGLEPHFDRELFGLIGTDQIATLLRQSSGYKERVRFYRQKSAKALAEANRKQLTKATQPAV